MKLSVSKNRIVKVVLLVILGQGLVACAKKPVKPFMPPPPQKTLQELRSSYIDQLGARGVQVIHVGETIRIILRDDFMFMPDSANLRQDFKPVLKQVAKFVSTYEKIEIKVAGYQDNQGKRNYLQALSTRQAQTVANFLWGQGIDARLMYAVGYNRLNPVGWNGSVSGRSDNRRVELSFRYFPKKSRYN